MAEPSQEFSCFICNIAGLPVKIGIAIFDENEVLESGLRLSEAVSQIVGRPIDPLAAHSTIICRKCHKTCQEYDEISKRLTSLKSKMADQFRQTLPKYNLSYDTYNKELPAMEVDVTAVKEQPAQIKKETGAPMKTLILPKSKMTPISSSLFVMNRNKLIPGNIDKVVSLKDCLSIRPKKVTWPGTSLIKPELTITSSFKDISGFNALTKAFASTLNASTSSSGTISNVSLLVELPPKNSDQKNAAESKFKKEITESPSISTDFVDPEGPSSTYCLKPSADMNKIYVDSVGQEKTPEKKMHSRNAVGNLPSRPAGTKAEKSPNKEASDVSEQSTEESFPKDKFVISEVEIVEDGQGDNSEDSEDHTILMDQDGSIIEVMRGKHIVGELLFPKDEQMSLAAPHGADSDSDTNGRYKIENQDSNDDTQIELQMSEDEETANAIIAAANKKGATYIKMGSGEMYRVKTIKSTLHEQDGLREARRETEPAVSTRIVERVGSVYTCLICKNASKVSADSESVDDASSEPTKRPEYGAVFTAPRDIMMHLKSSHHLRVYLCPVCGDVFRRRSEHDAHLTQHGEKKKTSSQTDRMKQYTCPVCSKKYSSRNLLDEHMNQHTGVRPYTCGTCSKSFASKYTYQAHMKTHTNRPRPFSCAQCNKSFFTFPNLSQHKKTHSGIKEFFCNICGKAFATQHNLDVHGVVHTGDKPYVCGLCEKAFARQAEIRDHMRTHTGERPFECDMCEAKFSQRSNLLSHRRATHLDDKRHACQYCDKRFKRRRLLDYHVKASHTGERPYKCVTCGATFVYPEHYKKHARAHSGEKPYVCEVCNRTFNSRDNRNAHRFTHSDKKPYECVVCGAGFMRKPLLYSHMNSQGHLSDVIVVNQARLTDKANTIAETPKADVLDEDKLQPSRSLAEANISEIFGDMDNLAEAHMETETSDKSNEGEATVNLVQTGDDGEHSLLTLSGGMAGDAGATAQDMLTSHDVDELLAQGSEVITTDEDGNILRLVQIQLPDGKTGWVALEP